MVSNYRPCFLHQLKGHLSAEQWEGSTKRAKNLFCEMSQPISCRLVSLNDVALIFRHKAKLHGALENLKVWVFFSRGKACRWCWCVVKRGPVSVCFWSYCVISWYHLKSVDISWYYLISGAGAAKALFPRTAPALARWFVNRRKGQFHFSFSAFQIRGTDFLFEKRIASVFGGQNSKRLVDWIHLNTHENSTTD